MDKRVKIHVKIFAFAHMHHRCHPCIECHKPGINTDKSSRIFPNKIPLNRIQETGIIWKRKLRAYPCSLACHNKSNFLKTWVWSTIKVIKSIPCNSICWNRLSWSSVRSFMNSMVSAGFSRYTFENGVELWVHFIFDKMCDCLWLRNEWKCHWRMWMEEETRAIAEKRWSVKHPLWVPLS